MIKRSRDRIRKDVDAQSVAIPRFLGSMSRHSGAPDAMTNQSFNPATVPPPAACCLPPAACRLPPAARRKLQPGHAGARRRTHAASRSICPPDRPRQNHLHRPANQPPRCRPGRWRSSNPIRARYREAPPLCAVSRAIARASPASILPETPRPRSAAISCSASGRDGSKSVTNPIKVGVLDSGPRVTASAR